MIKVKTLDEMPESIGGVSAEERETIVRKDHLDKKAHICTTDYVEYGKLMKRCREYPKEYKALGYDTCGGQAQTGYFECAAKRVRYSAPVSEERRAACAERMKTLVEKGVFGAKSKKKAARDASDASEAG